MPIADREPTSRTVLVQVFGGPGTGKQRAAEAVAAELDARGMSVTIVEGRAKAAAIAAARSANPSLVSLAESLLDRSYRAESQIMARNATNILEASLTCDVVITAEPLMQPTAYLKGASPTEAATLRRAALIAESDYYKLDIMAPDAPASDPAWALEGRPGAEWAEFKRTGAEGAADIVERLSGRAAERFKEKSPARTPGKERGAEERPAQGGPGSRETGGAEMAEEAKAAQEGREGSARDKFVYVTVPKKAYKDYPSTKEFVSKKTGEPFVKVRLPYKIPPVQTDAGPVDISGHTFVVRPQAIKDWPNDANYLSVGFRKANKEGEPWKVNLEKSTGHWEKEEGVEYENPKGRWVEDSSSKASITAQMLSETMQDYRDNRWERAVEDRAQKRLEQLGPEKAAVAPANANRFDRAVAERAAKLAADGTSRGEVPPTKQRAERPDAAKDTARAAASARAQAAEAPKQAQAIAR